SAAEAAVGRALELNERDGTGWCLMAQIHSRRGDPERARAACMEALSRDPQCELAARMLETTFGHDREHKRLPRNGKSRMARRGSSRVPLLTEATEP
ncbi:MAG: tetratricopeptide repeat protein, partial [Phycisphaerae bacterium]